MRSHKKYIRSVKGESKSCKGEAKNVSKGRDKRQQSKLAQGNSGSSTMSNWNGIQQETKEEEQNQVQDEVEVGRRDMSL